MDSLRVEGRPSFRRESSPTVVAIVVSYNSSGDIPECLRSLQAQRGVDLSLHVVDNASTDGTPDMVRREFPGVHLTANELNLGFARGNNQILEHEASAAYYALVNPDCVLPENAVATCVAYLEAHPNAAVAATRLVFPDGSLQPSCHTFLGPMNLLGETLGIHRAAPGLRALSSLHMPWFAHDRVLAVDWIAGAFLVVRGEALRRVGPLDPSFFMYGEEMDWCRRFGAAGWEVVFLPAPSVIHKGAGSSAPVAGPMFVENLKGRIRFVSKHRGRVAALLARAMIAVAVLGRLLWRELEGLLARMAGGESEEARRGRRRFRAAAVWVARGMRLENDRA